MRRGNLWLALTVSVTAIFAGCGDDSEETGNTAGQSGSGGGGDAGTGNSGGTGGAAGTAGTGGDAGSAGVGGSAGVSGSAGAGGSSGAGGEAGSSGAAGSAPVVPLRLAAYTYTGVAASYRTEVNFDNFTGERCSPTQVGNCTFRDCRASAGTLSGASAGTVTLTGSAFPDVTMDPVADGTYESFASATEYWKTDNPITFSATGAAVPAFQHELTVPAPVEVLDKTSVRVMDRGQAFDLAWEPTDQEISILLVQWFDTGLGFIAGTCDFPGTDGTGTIPVEVLSMFEPGPDAPPAGILIAHKTSMDTTAGDYPLEILVLNGSAVWAAFLDEPLGGTSSASQQLEAAYLQPWGEADLLVEDVLVTYVKPENTGDGPGFFVQADAVGPALFVTLDAAPAMPAVGDRVSFRVTDMELRNSAPRVVGLTDFATTSSGEDVEPLRQDITSADDLATNIAYYANELIHIEATIAGTWEAAATGHMRVPLTSTGITTTAPSGDGGLWLRVPTPTFDVSTMNEGCTVTVDGHLWRYHKDPQVHSYVPSEVAVDCP